MVEGLGVPLGVASPVNFKMLPLTVFAIFRAIVFVMLSALAQKKNIGIELFEPLIHIY